jgi:hypothetical protein
MSAHTYAENQFVEQPAIALPDAPAIGIGAAFFAKSCSDPMSSFIAIQFSRLPSASGQVANATINSQHELQMSGRSWP